MTEKEIETVNKILKGGDRVELMPVKDGVKIVRVKRETVTTIEYSAHS